MGVNSSFIFVFMYVRKLKHSNGKVYVQVIDKSSGKYKTVKSFGSAVEQSSIDTLERKAELWIKSQKGIVEFDFQDEISLFTKVLNNIISHKLIGIEFVLGKIFSKPF